MFPVTIGIYTKAKLAVLHGKKGEIKWEVDTVLGPSHLQILQFCMNKQDSALHALLTTQILRIFSLPLVLFPLKHLEMPGKYFSK